MRKITKQSFFGGDKRQQSMRMDWWRTGGHVYGSKCLTPFFWMTTSWSYHCYGPSGTMFDLCPPELHVIEDNRVCCTGAGSSICRAQLSGPGNTWCCQLDGTHLQSQHDWIAPTLLLLFRVQYPDTALEHNLSKWVKMHIRICLL